ncbi:deleted in malignant brain tumors 1 protein-like [Anolis sagrei]|uniref:deleted in malignant brain tumors 1 protein-like n=1 Tax=Anolis sagrei TaxID=38937 RepID=UPI003520DAD5
MWLSLGIAFLVMSSSMAESDHMEIRLEGGPNLCSGRVEVFLSGQWTSVCDDSWGIEEAMVVCRQLGCGSAVSATHEAQFGNGWVPIGLDDVRCGGTESALSECPASPWGEHDCSHEETAGVICSGQLLSSDPMHQTEIRLADGLNNCSGRVELFHHGEWGMICGDGWGIEEAKVVCQEMGCGSAKMDQSGTWNGSGTGPIWLDDVHCKGTESALHQCLASPLGRYDCDSGETASVVCSEVRLVDGPTPCSGRVEVFLNKTWGTVCDNGWDLEDARVVCQEVGCGEPLVAATGVRFGQGSGPIWMDQVNCTGEEKVLKECPQEKSLNLTCDHRNYAGVECAVLRLVDGHNRCAGKVELLHEGQWRMVYNEGLGDKEARVVCRYLGCGTALPAPHYPIYAEKMAPFWLDGFHCNGSETSLSKCEIGPRWEYYFNSDRVFYMAGVICTEFLLVNGSSNCSGRVEVFHNETWGTICDAGWDLQDAQVVCRELGCGEALRASGGARFGGGTGPIWLEGMNCTGKEDSLRQCPKGQRGEHGCDHSRDASVECADPRKFRLVNGFSRCSGRIEVFHNQEWGTLCDYTWDLTPAQVLCKELECGDVISVPWGDYFGRTNSPVWAFSFYCKGSDDALSDCSYIDEEYCYRGKGAAVVCSVFDEAHTSAEITEATKRMVEAWLPKMRQLTVRPAFVVSDSGANVVQAIRDMGFTELRLVNGPDRCSGNLEVLHNQQWGTVCDSGWDARDAQVVCRELNCGDASTALGGVRYGQGSGLIWLENVNCTGGETSLAACPKSPWGKHSCNHNQDPLLGAHDSSCCAYRFIGTRKPPHHGKVTVRRGGDSIILCDLRDRRPCGSGEAAGVICSEARLVNGPNPCSGQIELLHNQEWGTVCDTSWDIHDAQVVCRELGCGNALKAFRGAHHGQGSGPIWLEGLNCTGKEASLRECPRSPWGEHHCNHSQDASVECTGWIRLANGSSRCSGTVEVLHKQQWIAISLCDKNWDKYENRVVCREISCSEISLDFKIFPFYNNKMPSIDSCKWTANDLTECDLTDLKEESCSHENAVPFMCPEPGKYAREIMELAFKSMKALFVLPKPTGTRLVNGRNSCSGRVEVFVYLYWWSVCDGGWDLRDAQVVCRELDCGAALSAPGGSLFGNEEDVRNIPYEPKCLGTEVAFNQCMFDLRYQCLSDESAGVVCSDLRLMNGTSPCSGRVEILHDDEWGTICDAGWDLQDAQVVCRQLGCGNASKALGGAHDGQGSGPIWLESINCTGEEEFLKECQKGGWGEHSCSHSQDASVECSETRLVNGPDHCSGRVEVFRNGTWGTVCDDGWDLRDAQVVCRELGCGEAVSAPEEAHFGKGKDPILINEVQCNGTEVSLYNCFYKMHTLYECRHEEDASVVCSDLRLNGTSPCSGRVEVFHNDAWGTVCDAGWDLQDAQVVCRQLGCGNASKALGGAHYGQGSGPIWLESINCTGEEASLKECQKESWGKQSCNHSQDASVECSAVDSSLEISIHLGVAALVFLALVGIVAEAGCRRRRKTIRRRRRKRRREQQP